MRNLGFLLPLAVLFVPLFWSAEPPAKQKLQDAEIAAAFADSDRVIVIDYSHRG